MKKYKFGGYQVEMDMNATRNWYAASEGWGCECGHCRNFLKLAQKKALPGRIIEILDELGISPEKPTYVGELYTDDAGIHYQFSYRIVGIIIDVPKDKDSDTPDKGRCCHEPYPYGAPGFPQPHFDLEFFATFPWVLEEGRSGGVL